MSAERTLRRPLWFDLTILALAGVIFLGFLSLGNWQLRRLAWKVDLIEAVETRAFGAPIAAPRGEVRRDTHAYLRITATGKYLHGETRRVKASTELGLGYWLMTPLQTSDWVIWVNRGFIPAGLAPSEWQQPEGVQTVDGLLRVTEPDGTFLEKNDPDRNRWFSRDVGALSEGASLSSASAPYFIDAEDVAGPSAWPRGGLTVVNFRNPHLSYALTWYAMAGLFLLAMAFVVWGRLKPNGVKAAGLSEVR
ncbi:MAG: SURF1 family protein [Pseudomonadota bacterium]